MSYNPQNPNGQVTSANSSPVVVASNQSAIDQNLSKVNGNTVATAANGVQQVGITDGSGNAITSTANALDVNIKSGGTNTLGGVELVDSGGTNKASISAGGAVKVDGSAATQPVSLTSLPALATGSNTIGAISNSSLAVTQTTAANLNATVTPAAGTGSAIPAAAQPAGFQARTSEQTATSNTDNTIAVVDKAGKQIVLPYANPENFVSGSASATGTTSTSVITATTGLKTYITDVLVANTGSSTALVTIQNGNGGSTLLTTIAPAGGGSNIHLAVPIPTTSTNTAVYFAAGTATTTLYITVSGYQGV
jgi:hypothetical protein